MAAKDRTLYVLKNLWENSDEENPATVSDILSALASEDIKVERHALMSDIEKLTEFGIDIVCVKSSPNKYFIGQRTFELPELKLLVDAVESSRFISAAQSGRLVGKLCGMASTHQATELNRHLYIDGRVKSDCKTLYYTVDLIHKAINDRKRIRFKYIEYTAEKKKVYKHNGCIYEFSTYAMLWHDDRYYVLGYSERHGKIVKFRVDRIAKAEATDIPSVKEPADFDPVSYLKNIIAMYDGRMERVRLKCEADMMKVIIDRFGADVYTESLDDGFIVEVNVSVSPTFFGWVFGFAGKIKIVSPQSVAAEYKKALKKAISEC